MADLCGMTVRNYGVRLRPSRADALVLGNGPSLREVDLVGLGDTPTVGMNAAYRYWERVGWYPTHYCCLDNELVATHHKAIRDLLGEGKVQTAFLTAEILAYCPELRDSPNCLFIESFLGTHSRYNLPQLEHPAFRSSDPNKLTTGAYAVRYAIYLGYETIAIMGVDCTYKPLDRDVASRGGLALEMTATPQSNPNYFFDDYQRAGDRFNIPSPEVHQGNLHLQSFEVLRDDLVHNAIDVRVVNCSDTSELASRGVFPFEGFDDVIGCNGVGALAVPMVTAEVDQLIANMRAWSQPALLPSDNAHDPDPIPLVCILSGEREEALERQVRRAFEELPNLRWAFSRVDFKYCGIPKELDKYERDYSKRPGRFGYKSGPNLQFFEAMKLLRPYGRYVFYMETDCRPIRPGWLSALQRIVREAEPFWVMGSIYRGVGGLETAYRGHVNGNAVYAVGDPKFSEFAESIWRPALDDLVKSRPATAYDFALPLFWEDAAPLEDHDKWLTYSAVRHLIRYTDYIQNHGGRSDLNGMGLSVEEIRSRSPRTYVVHGRHLTIAPTSEIS